MTRVPYIDLKRIECVVQNQSTSYCQFLFNIGFKYIYKSYTSSSFWLTLIIK